MSNKVLIKLADEIANYHWDVGDREKAAEFATRLRGEAAQGEQEAAAAATVSVCDGKEQDAFEEWAEAEKYVMNTHPLHWLFLDPKTYAARQGWKAAIEYVNARSQPAAPTPVAGDAVAYGSEEWQAIRKERESKLPKLPHEGALMPPERNGDYQRGYDAEDMRDYALDAIENDRESDRVGILEAFADGVEAARSGKIPGVYAAALAQDRASQGENHE
jgi:hypothetical protein